MSPERATRNDRRYRREAVLELKLRHLLRWRLPGATEVGIWGAGQTIYGAKVIRAADLPTAGALPLLIAVGVDGARDLIRGELTKLGYLKPGDFFVFNKQ